MPMPKGDPKLFKSGLNFWFPKRDVNETKAYNESHYFPLNFWFPKRDILLYGCIKRHFALWLQYRPACPRVAFAKRGKAGLYQPRASEMKVYAEG